MLSSYYQSLLMLVLPPIDVGSYLCGPVTAKSRRKQHWESSSGEIKGRSWIFFANAIQTKCKINLFLHSKVIPYAFNFCTCTRH